MVVISSNIKGSFEERFLSVFVYGDTSMADPTEATIEVLCPDIPHVHTVVQTIYPFRSSNLAIVIEVVDMRIGSDDVVVWF